LSAYLSVTSVRSRKLHIVISDFADDNDRCKLENLTKFKVQKFVEKIAIKAVVETLLYWIFFVRFCLNISIFSYLLRQ